VPADTTSQTSAAAVDSSEAAAQQAAGSSRVQFLVRESTRGRVIWLWPAATIGCLALAGYRFGTVGALIVAAQLGATLTFVSCLRLRPGRTTSAALAAVAAGTALVVALLWQATPASQRPPAATASTNAGPADLRGSHPTAAELRRLNLRGAQLTGANLDEAVLSHRDLSGATAAGASLRRANLTGALLRGADLRGADLSGACLRDVDLDGAALAGIRVSDADFGDRNLDPHLTRTFEGTPLPSGTAPSCHR
jgi:hypothetical protein